jgi:hypothetical protein
MERQTENFTSGNNFTPRGQNSLLGDNFSPGGKKLPLGAMLRMGLRAPSCADQEGHQRSKEKSFGPCNFTLLVTAVQHNKK